MARTEQTQSVYSPRSLKMEKENVHNFTPRRSPGSGFKSPLRHSAVRRSPPGSSKLLREHFAQLGVSGSTRRRRLMAAGPIRLTQSSASASPRRRIGLDGTQRTPSKELLKSTVASRNQRVILKSDEDSSATDQSFCSIGGDWEMSGTPPRRLDCVDPVAFTLSRGGEEDPKWLMEQDTSYSIPKVSADLGDVYGDYSQIARPIPVFARRDL